MPVILPAATWSGWLGETEATADDLRSMLKPLPPEQLQIWPVDKRVGNVKNEGAELALPI
jgi:putative SOS response-associated peptidase YedK